MKKILLFSAILLAGLAAAHLPADQRTEPMDIIVALDKSLSMKGKIESVIAYANEYLIDQLLIPGDYFLVVAFYGKTEIPVALRIEGEADKQRAKQAIARLKADGRFTDIGNALDVLGSEVEKLGDNKRRKYLLLLTDGIQEAPPGSKYYSPDGTFSHAYLENTKTIQKKGWKIHILGIGTHEEAKRLAENLAAGFSQVSEAPTKEELIRQTQGFLAGIELVSGPQLAAFDPLGRGRIRFGLQSKGTREPQELRIAAVLLETPQGREQNILRAPVALTVPPDGILEAALPVRLSPRLPPGDYQTALQFQFEGQRRFEPVAMTVSFRVQSLLAGFWYWMLAAAAVIALIVVLLILMAARLRKIRVRFRLVVEGRKSSRQEKAFTIVEGRPLFLDQDEDGVRIADARSAASIARLAAIPDGIRLTVLKPERFVKLRSVPQNVLDFDLRIRTEAKKELTVRLTGAK